FLRVERAPVGGIHGRPASHGDQLCLGPTFSFRSHRDSPTIKESTPPISIVRSTIHPATSLDQPESIDSPVSNPDNTIPRTLQVAPAYFRISTSGRQRLRQHNLAPADGFLQGSDDPFDRDGACFRGSFQCPLGGNGSRLGGIPPHRPGARDGPQDDPF